MDDKNIIQPAQITQMKEESASGKLRLESSHIAYHSGYTCRDHPE